MTLGKELSAENERVPFTSTVSAKQHPYFVKKRLAPVRKSTTGIVWPCFFLFFLR